MFKKPVEGLAKETHYEPLPPEARAVVIAAQTRGWLLPSATIDAMVRQRSRRQRNARRIDGFPNRTALRH